jgi:hypothetical protein
MGAIGLFGNVTIVCSVVVSLLTLLDWALTDNQRRALTDKAIVVWHWLEHERSLDYLKKFKNFDVQWKSSALTHALIVGALGLAGGPHAIWVFVGTALASLVNVLWLHPVLLSWITKGDMARIYLLKSTLCVLPIIFAIVAFPNWVSAGFATDRATLGLVQPLQNVLLELMFGIFAASGSVLLYFWCINLFLESLRGIGYLIFSFSRLILVRIMDSPKEIVLALSFMVGCIGAVLKTFSRSGGHGL